MVCEHRDTHPCEHTRCDVLGEEAGAQSPGDTYRPSGNQSQRHALVVLRRDAHRLRLLSVASLGWRPGSASMPAPWAMTVACTGLQGRRSASPVRPRQPSVRLANGDFSMPESAL